MMRMRHLPLVRTEWRVNRSSKVAYHYNASPSNIRSRIAEGRSMRQQHGLALQHVDDVHYKVTRAFCQGQWNHALEIEEAWRAGKGHYEPMKRTVSPTLLQTAGFRSLGDIHGARDNRMPQVKQPGTNLPPHVRNQLRRRAKEPLSRIKLSTLKENLKLGSKDLLEDSMPDMLSIDPYVSTLEFAAPFRLRDRHWDTYNPYPAPIPIDTQDAIISSPRLWSSRLPPGLAIPDNLILGPQAYVAASTRVWNTHLPPGLAIPGDLVLGPLAYVATPIDI